REMSGAVRELQEPRAFRKRGRPLPRCAGADTEDGVPVRARRHDAAHFRPDPTYAGLCRCPRATPKLMTACEVRSMPQPYSPPDLARARCRTPGSSGVEPAGRHRVLPGSAGNLAGTPVVVAGGCS